MNNKNFLLALALCVGFSSTITIAMDMQPSPQAPQSTWQSFKQTVSNWWQGTQKNISYAGTQLTHAKNYTFKISQQLMNRISQWSVQTQIGVFTGVVISLAGIYGRNEITAMFKNALEQASPYAEKAANLASRGVDYATENPKVAATIGTGAALAGGKLAYDYQSVKALDAKLFAKKFNQESIDQEFKIAYENNSSNLLTTVLRNKLNDPNSSEEIIDNIKKCLQNNTYGNGLSAEVNNLKREVELAIMGDGRLNRNLLKTKKG